MRWPCPSCKTMCRSKEAARHKVCCSTRHDTHASECVVSSTNKTRNPSVTWLLLHGGGDLSLRSGSATPRLEVKGKNEERMAEGAGAAAAVVATAAINKKARRGGDGANGMGC
jgi:hypothetical protein